MKRLAIVALIVGGVSFVLAVVSRIMLQPLKILPHGVLPITLLNFTNTCLLAAIALLLLELIKACKK